MKLPKETLSKLSMFGTQLAGVKTPEDLTAVLTNLISETEDYHDLRMVDDSFSNLYSGDWVSMVFEDRDDDFGEVIAMVIDEDENDDGSFYNVLVLDPETSRGVSQACLTSDLFVRRILRASEVFPIIRKEKGED